MICFQTTSKLWYTEPQSTGNLIRQTISGRGPVKARKFVSGWNASPKLQLVLSQGTDGCVWTPCCKFPVCCRARCIPNAMASCICPGRLARKCDVKDCNEITCLEHRMQWLFMKSQRGRSCITLSLSASEAKTWALPRRSAWSLEISIGAGEWSWRSKGMSARARATVELKVVHDIHWIVCASCIPAMFENLVTMLTKWHAINGVLRKINLGVSNPRPGMHQGIMFLHFKSSGSSEGTKTT